MIFTLTIYPQASRKLVPGTKTFAVGLKKDQDIADLIACLKTARQDGRASQQDAGDLLLR